MLPAYVAVTAAHSEAKTRPGTVKRFGPLVQTAVVAWSDDYGSSLGAALAFYAVLCVAALLLVALALSGLILDPASAQRALPAVLGSGTAAALLNQTHAWSGGWIALAAGLVTLAVGIVALFGELQDALNRIWRAPLPRPPGLLRLIRERLPCFGTMLGVGLLVLALLCASAAIAALAGRGSDPFGGRTLPLELVHCGASLALFTLAFARVYQSVPRVPVAWRDVWIGAAVTALLFTIGESGLGWYLGRFAIASPLAAAAAPIALAVWAYYSAQVFLLGAELSRAFAHTLGSRRKQPAATPALVTPRRPRVTGQPEAPILVRPWPHDRAPQRGALRARSERT
jgi:membrane protein